LSHYDETSEWVFTGFIFFLGLTLGWFCKFNAVTIVAGLLIFIPVINFIIQVDHFFFSLPFVAGFLVHTHKKILMLVTSRS